MTELRTRPVADAHPGPVRQRRRRSPGRLLIATVALLGVLVLLYPPTASWFSAVEERAQIDDYVERVTSLPSEQHAQLLAEADAYNDDFVRGLIVDPFSNTSETSRPVDDDARAYLEQLSLDAHGVMARVTIPAIGVDLPIYHGATDATLRQGVGHLYGSSLPVGGADTHAVLTGHSGLPEAELFTGLFDLVIGDEFTISTLGRTLTYRVVVIDTVEPTQIETLGVVPGADLVTLVTCTPIGINSHRLIVQAERIPTPDEARVGAQASEAPFPWWALGAGAALAGWAAVAVITLRRGRARRATTGRRARAARRTTTP